MSEPATHPGSNGPGAPPAAPRRYLCPYCGAVTADSRRCGSCGGHLDPLSRQATQNTMGPWQIHDPGHPFRPGCSFATVRKLIERGQITRRTILRGPTTRQFWTFADRTPSVANLLGVCHNCHAEVSAEAFLCAACGASFTPETDRQYLGLAPRRPLPGEAPADQVAHLASDGAGMPDGPRRGEEDGGGDDGPAEGRRVQRPAFPADPRPALQRSRRSPVAVIAVVAVAGVIGLSLGAAGALAVAVGMGWIDLPGEDGSGADERGLRLRSAPIPDVGAGGAAAGAAGAPGSGEAEDAGGGGGGGGAGEADMPAPEGDLAPDEPSAGGSGPAEPELEPAPAPGLGPVVPARLRRLP